MSIRKMNELPIYSKRLVIVKGVIQKVTDLMDFAGMKLMPRTNVLRDRKGLSI